MLGIRLTWEKRYITLAPVATLLGLAFRLYDPDRLIGAKACRHHARLDSDRTRRACTSAAGICRSNAAFMNGPNWGKGVFVPMDAMIGGVEYVGQGWKMLMNCLAAGRSISLPANAVGMAKLCALTTGAYGRVRRQFGVSIGNFEGVEEAIARIGGNLYIMDAARVMTARRGRLGREALGHIGDRQVSPDRARAADDQRRDGRAWRQGRSAWGRATISRTPTSRRRSRSRWKALTS